MDYKTRRINIVERYFFRKIDEKNGGQRKFHIILNLKREKRKRKETKRLKGSIEEL